MASEKPRVVIVGGGLSGLTAACTLLRTGQVNVALLEANQYLGGQAASWKDKEGNDIETGIHLLFPWYINMLRLYESIGKPLPLVPSDGNLYILDGQTKKTLVLEGDYKSLLIAIRGIMKYQGITFSEKLKLLRFLFRVLSSPLSDVEGFDRQSVRQFLTRAGMSENLIQQLAVATITIQGLPAHLASAASFLKFLKMLYGAKGYFNTAFLAEPICQALVGPLEDYILRQGGEIVLGANVYQVKTSNGVAQALLYDKGSYDNITALILAIPSYRVPRLLPHVWSMEPTFRKLHTLKSADVVTLQLHYERRVFRDGNVYISNRRGVIFDAVCDKAYHWKNPDLSGSIVQVLIDAAGDLRYLSDEELTQKVLSDLAMFFPEVRSLAPKSCTILRHVNIYAETGPGYWSRVPRGHETPVRNLFLAGDYTAGPYHYGMESAIVSGIASANAVLASFGLPQHPIVRPEFPLPVKFIEILNPFGFKSRR